MPKSRRRKKKPVRVTSDPSVIKMTPRVERILREQHDAFVNKFGREPGAGDPVFFDPDADTPQPMDRVKLDADIRATMTAIGLPPEFVYAYEKTGMMLFSDDLSHIPADRRAEWEAAIDEYFALKKNPN